MAWTESESGGYTKYTQNLANGGTDEITLAGAGALISTVSDVLVSTKSVSGAYVGLFLLTGGTAANPGTVSIPRGAHGLRLAAVGGSGVVTVFVGDYSGGQGDLTISGIGADPS